MLFFHNKILLNIINKLLLLLLNPWSNFYVFQNFVGLSVFFVCPQNDYLSTYNSFPVWHWLQVLCFKKTAAVWNICIFKQWMADRFQKFNGAECHITASQPAKLYIVTDGNNWSKFQCGYGKLDIDFKMTHPFGFPGVKRLGHVTGHNPILAPGSRKVELYLSLPSVPTWQIMGQFYH